MLCGVGGRREGERAKLEQGGGMQESLGGRMEKTVIT